MNDRESDAPSDQAPSRRRWMQLRLSWLLILIAFVSAGLAIYLYRPRLASNNLHRLVPRNRLELDRHYVQWNQAGTKFALHGWETPVEIRDSTMLWKFETLCEDKKVINFAFSGRDSLIAYGENDTRVILLDLASGTSSILETGNTQPDFCFHPDGTKIATEGPKGHTLIWDLKTHEVVQKIYVGHAHSAQTIRYSPDGSRLAVGDRNNTTNIFDADSGDRLHTLDKRETQELMFHPDGNTIAIAYCDGNIGLWDVASGALIKMVPTSAEEIYSLDWSRDGRILLSGGKNGRIELWSGADLTRLRSLPAPEWVISVRFRPDMRGFFTAGGSIDQTGYRYMEEWEVPSQAKRWLLDLL